MLLWEVSQIFFSVAELTIQAANDTYSINDKAMIQAEALEIRKSCCLNTHDSGENAIFRNNGAGAVF